MPIFNEKPFTSITVKINQLLKPNRNPDLEDELLELFLHDLLDLIELQPGPGPAEAARAVRKNIKYGSSVGSQLRSLDLLELLVMNLGSRIGPQIASDEKLIDVLKGIVNGTGRTGLGTVYDRRVQQKVRNMAIGWKLELRDLGGYRGMALLWQCIPGQKSRSRGHTRSRSAFDDQYAIDDVPGTPDLRRSSPPDLTRSPSELRKSPPPPRPLEASPFAGRDIRRENRRTEKYEKKAEKSEKKADKKRKKRSKRGVLYADEQYKIPQINYDVEAPKIRNVLADCQSHTAALSNLLLQLPDGVDPLSDDKLVKEFHKCKKVRHAVLKYLQFVGAGDESLKPEKTRQLDEEFLGSLIMANESLVTVFKLYDRACGFTEEDPRPEESDSDESYYTSDSDDLEDQMDSLDIQEGSSSRLQEAMSKPAPPPPVSRKKSFDSESLKTVESNPFGDSHELGR